MVLAPVRGAERFYIKANCSLLMSKENQKTTSDFDALDPRERGCSPLIIPKELSKRKKASRCAKTGCGSQRLLRCRSHPAGRCPNNSSLFPPLAAVVAVALFSRFSDLLLRSRCYALAGREVQQKREIFGGAVNGRSTKNAFSEAASIFGLRQPLRGLKGASSPFLVDPARRNRWCFSGSLLARKRERSLKEEEPSLYQRRTKNESL